MDNENVNPDPSHMPKHRCGACEDVGCECCLPPFEGGPLADTIAQVLAGLVVVPDDEAELEAALGCSPYLGCECANCAAEAKAEHEGERAAEMAVERYFENRGQTYSEEVDEARAHGQLSLDFGESLAEARGDYTD